MEGPETYEKPLQAVWLNRKLAVIQEDLATLTAQWEAEATKLAVLE